MRAQDSPWCAVPVAPARALVPRCILRKFHDRRHATYRVSSISSQNNGTFLSTALGVRIPVSTHQKVTSSGSNVLPFITNRAGGPF